MGNKQETGTVEIDLLELINALVKKWAWLLASTVIVSLLFGIYAIKMITPTYQASVLMYVNNSSYSSAIDSISSKLDSTVMKSADKYVSTYLVILRSRLTMEEVAARANVSYSPTKLSKMVSGASVDDTAIFRITVTGHDPEEACLIANTISEVLPEKIGNIIDGTSCRVVDSAIVPSGRSAPSYSRYFAIGAVIGFLLVAAVVVIYTIFNDQITSSDWLLESFDESVPLLSVVPNNTTSSKNKYSKYYTRYYGKSYAYYGDRTDTDNKKS